jgi:hypothetical protein
MSVAGAEWSRSLDWCCVDPCANLDLIIFTEKSQLLLNGELRSDRLSYAICAIMASKVLLFSFLLLSYVQKLRRILFHIA